MGVSKWFLVVLGVVLCLLLVPFIFRGPPEEPSFQPPPRVSTLPPIISSSTSIFTTSLALPERETLECIDYPHVSDKDDCYLRAAIRFRDPDWCARVKGTGVEDCLYQGAYSTLYEQFCIEIKSVDEKTKCLDMVEKRGAQPDIIALNAWAEVNEGEVWTARFQTEGGASDFELIPERGSTFKEHPADDESTIDDLEFISLTCDGDIVEEFDFKDRYRGFVFKDYSCDGETVVSVRVHSGGRHRMKVNYGRTRGFGVGAKEP